MTKVPPPTESAERQRLAEDAVRAANWKRWGPYLAERQWATVREDYSLDGDSWRYFPHDHARSRAYRWGEDGLLGWTDRECRLCFALALWNERDPILKERMFGLTGMGPGGSQGNHGEDVKEEYFYLDSTPTHSYARGLYRYPQAAFPYERLIEENRRRGVAQPEFELADTGIFDEGRYFDIEIEYAKAAPDDILIRVTAHNRGPDAAPLHLLPTVWFRNTWSWGCRHEGCTAKPRIEGLGGDGLALRHETLGDFTLRFESAPDGRVPPTLFTENETNAERLFGTPNASPYVKDAFHRHIVGGEAHAVNPAGHGTKAAAHYRVVVAPGGSVRIRLRLAAGDGTRTPATAPDIDAMVARRAAECDAFYASVIPSTRSADERHVARQAYAGLLWNKQFYHFVVPDWIQGDPDMPPPPDERRRGRNATWSHVYARDVLSVPDKWEYPWFAAWDTAFHMIPFARIDPDFAKDQTIRLLREWYMHPNGQIPAYEFEFGDVNPPVHAWAALQVYRADGGRDRVFLERVFQKLLLNFTWWVNRKDADGRNIFSGGFLGLDNIGVFDRSKPLPDGGALQQADATAWMAFYALTMLDIAIILADGGVHPAYGDMASKFLEHFLQICDAMNAIGGTGLWDEDDGFYYDQIHVPGRAPRRIKIRSMVGILPLIAVCVLDQQSLDRLPGFRARFEWFVAHRRDLARHIGWAEADRGAGGRMWLLSVPSRPRLERMLARLLSEAEFLSPFGVRSMSRAHRDTPFVFHSDGGDLGVEYAPGEANTHLFGGNSNWRGPIWFPTNFLLIEALKRYHRFYGDDLTVACPLESGPRMNLRQAAAEIERRMTALFLPGADGRRPCMGDGEIDRRNGGRWWFHEYFDAETGRGLGASHQTGWTALVTQLRETGP